MKIFFIPDREKFLNLVEKSHGDVILHLPDGKQLDLKRSLAAKQLLRIMPSRQSGLQISLSNPVDTSAFLQYMMEAGS